MFNFIDDLVEVLSTFIKPFLYILVSVLIVGIPLFLVAKFFDVLTAWFY
ncbi:hypothetical protein [Solibacillus sp. CAU 1738]